MTDRVGHQFGNYRLLQRLGTGGFAEVYLAEHRYLKTQAAIKVLHTQMTSEDQQRFLSEAQTIAQLRHPHIVQVFDFGIQDGTPYLVMDYAPGGTLRQRHPRGTRLPEATILGYAKQIADALQYAHDQRLIHRDVKPENLLLGRANDVLLSDFGIATVAQSTSEMQTQGFAGTASYAAPEQLRGKPVQASDQYALGVVVYEWLSGQTPFAGSPLEVATQQVLSPPPPLREKLPGVASALEQVVMTALSKEPGERFGSVRAFATALEQAMQATPDVSIYSAPTQQMPPTPAAQADDLPPPPLQSAPLPETLPVAPAGWANGALPTSPPPDETFATPAPVLAKSDARKPTAPDSAPSPKPALRAPAPTRQRKRTRGRVMLLLLLVVLLIGGGLLAADLIIQQQATDAAQASGTATAQALANAQATAAANAASTATAQAQATAGVIQTATTGLPNYDDPLTAGNVTNPTWMNDGTACFFAADGYHAHAETNTAQTCSETGRTFQNATFTVEMRLRSGYAGGLVLHMQDNQQGYFFEVGVAGNYKIGMWGAPGILQEWTNTPAIHQGLFSTNTLQVIVMANTFRFYVNGVYVTTVRDITFGAGAIGFVSETSADGPGEAVFSNLKVYNAS